MSDQGPGAGLEAGLEAGLKAGLKTVAAQPEVAQPQAAAAVPAESACETRPLPQVQFVDDAQLERITDQHYRTFCLPCAPFEERQ